MTKLALCDVRGPLADLTEKLSGEEGPQWLNALKSFLRKQNPWDVRTFSTFTTITLGSSAKAYRKVLKSNGFRISDYADEILGKTPMSAEKTQLDLVVATVAELGFPNGATRDQIYTRAHELGLSLCPAEVGPALRLAYPNQPNGEWLLIAMEPITGSGGDLGVFYVGHGDDVRWLYARWRYLDSVWYADDRWVFVRK